MTTYGESTQLRPDSTSIKRVSVVALCFQFYRIIHLRWASLHIDSMRLLCLTYLMIKASGLLVVKVRILIAIKIYLFFSSSFGFWSNGKVKIIYKYEVQCMYVSTWTMLYVHCIAWNWFHPSTGLLYLRLSLCLRCLRIKQSSLCIGCVLAHEHRR